MRVLIWLLVVHSFIPYAGAETKAPQIKSWKTFQNDNGYEVKYPDCWKVEINDPDQFEQPPTSAKDIFLGEASACARPRLDPEIPNGVSVSGGWEFFKTLAEAKGDIDRKEKAMRSQIGGGRLIALKRSRLGSDEALTYVDMLSYNKIRWEIRLYCPSLRRISISGSTIKDPDPGLIAKIKSGDLSPPEPEKTIIESIRCAQPVVKAMAPKKPKIEEKSN